MVWNKVASIIEDAEISVLKSNKFFKKWAQKAIFRGSISIIQWQKFIIVKKFQMIMMI